MPLLVAVTFDAWLPLNAYPIMKARGLVGTYFVDPDYLDSPGWATTAQLNELRAAGWSIQAYSGVNMVALLASGGPAAARARMAEVKRGMAAKGFPITTFAPSQVAWNLELRNMAADYFLRVRAVSGSARQDYPFPDPLWISQGGVDSLSYHDTPASLVAQIDRWEQIGGVVTFVVHKVGDDADPAYSVSVEAFTALCDRIAAEVKAGRVRVITL